MRLTGPDLALITVAISGPEDALAVEVAVSELALETLTT